MKKSWNFIWRNRYYILSLWYRNKSIVMKKRTAEQQARYYEVGETANDFFNYLIDNCLLYDNYKKFNKLYKEMYRYCQKQFKSYLINCIAESENNASGMWDTWFYMKCLRALP